jgi:disulfide bond formation protein DsbB
MPFETMRTFFALAALAANVASVGIIVLGVAGRAKPTSPFEFLRGTTMWFAGAIALFATLGSLYLSEIAHLIPCKLCWYQRIAMYPTALILLMAAARKDARVRLYAATLATIGAGIALWHRTLQAFPSLDSGACAAVGPPCSAPYIVVFGFVTIPYMALSAFLLILALLWADRVNERRPTTATDQTDTPVQEETSG